MPRKPHHPWPKGILEHQTGDTVRLSIPFTWNLRDAYQRAAWHDANGLRVLAGGPAVNLMPDFMAPVAEVGHHWENAVQYHNPDATFTSRGCVRRCKFCAVPRAEGAFRELDDWPLAPIVCDNNFLAASDAHFDRVIDRLKPIAHRGIDFNQGLDARLMTPYRAGRLAELRCLARLAFDHLSVEGAFLSAFQMLRDAGFPLHKIRCYVLIGYDDTPEDALYRLELVRSLGIKPFPGRYQPLDALAKNAYVHPNWTAFELRRYQSYWSRLHYHSHIPFEEYDHTYRRNPRHKNKQQPLGQKLRTPAPPPRPKTAQHGGMSP
jgi:hypothetical protein